MGGKKKTKASNKRVPYLDLADRASPNYREEESRITIIGQHVTLQREITGVTVDDILEPNEHGIQERKCDRYIRKVLHKFPTITKYTLHRLIKDQVVLIKFYPPETV